MTQLTNDITDLTVVCSKCGSEFNPGDDNTFFDLEDDYAECRLCPKPIIQDYERKAINYENGSDWELEDYIHDDGTIMLEGVELDMKRFINELEVMADDVLLKLQEHFDATIEELETGCISFEDIYNFMHDKQLFDTTGNSYNWGYFGPTYNFGTIGTGYNSLGLVRFHRGGDVRGNYQKAKACYGEVLFHPPIDMVIQLETSGGNYRLTNRDLEAYYFELYNQEENYHEFQEKPLEDIEEFFNFDDSDYDSLDRIVWW